MFKIPGVRKSVDGELGESHRRMCNRNANRAERDRNSRWCFAKNATERGGSFAADACCLNCSVVGSARTECLSIFPQSVNETVTICRRIVYNPG